MNHPIIIYVLLFSKTRMENSIHKTKRKLKKNILFHIEKKEHINIRHKIFLSAVYGIYDHDRSITKYT